MSRFDYQRMVHRALRHVIRYALDEVSEEGLVGDHHFYITFYSRAPGVEVPTFLLEQEQYAETITIVLQHRYWDLVVERDSFSVTLAFSGKRHRITVPYKAVESFADPEAQFGLHFDVEEEELGVEDAEPDSENEANDEERDPFSRDSAGDDDEPAENDAPAPVVRLDEFRKR